MKYLFLILLSNLFVANAQIGINTTSPNATLDVNGNAIIRSISPATANECDKILVTNSSVNEIKSVNLPKSYIKGIGGTGFSVSSTNLYSTWKKVTFPTLSFDENSDFDVTNQYFTAPMNGIYAISFYVKMNSLVSLTDVGAGILKDSSGTLTVEINETFSSFNLLGIETSPVRKVTTLLKLNTSDKIYFCIQSTNLSVFTNSEAQFTIQQVN